MTTPGIARPFGRSLTLGFRKLSLFETFIVEPALREAMILSGGRLVGPVSERPSGKVNRCPRPDTTFGWMSFSPDTYAHCAAVSGATNKSVSCRTPADYRLSESCLVGHLLTTDRPEPADHKPSGACWPHGGRNPLTTGCPESALADSSLSVDPV